MTNEDRDAEIRKDAERISQDLKEDQRAGFVEDYIACSRTINEYIDTRLHRFQVEAAEVVGAIVPGRPAVVEHILNLHTLALKDIVARFIFATSRVGDPGLRRLVSDTLPDIFGVAMTALSEMDTKNVAREGKEGALQ